MLAAEVAALNAEISRLRTVAEQPPSLPPAAGCPPVEYLYLDSMTSNSSEVVTQARSAGNTGGPYREPFIGWVIAATALFLAGATCCLVAMSSTTCYCRHRAGKEIGTQTHLDQPSGSCMEMGASVVDVDVVVPPPSLEREEVSSAHRTGRCLASSSSPTRRGGRMEVMRPHDLPAALAIATTGPSPAPEVVVLPRGTPPRKLTPHGVVPEPPSQAVVFI